MLLGWLMANGQTIYPGDVDNNGEVNQYDLLYAGYAYGQIGPMRPNAGTIFFPQFIPLLWPDSFPGNGPSYAYADANGNGAVDFADILTVIANYGQTHGDPTPTEIIAGFEGIDPPLFINTSGIAQPIVAGSVIQLPILLGTDALEASGVNGIAFGIHYSPSQIINNVVLDLNENWMNADGNALYFQTHAGNPLGTSEIDVAMTRFGISPVSGSGQIGLLTIVIEDDLVDFIPVGDSLEVLITFDSIFMINGAFQSLPVASNEVHLMVHHPDAITDISPQPDGVTLEVFPNPVSDKVQVICSEKIEACTLTNQLGQALQVVQQSLSEHFTQLDVSALPAGTYWLRVQTSAGIVVRLVLKE